MIQLITAFVVVVFLVLAFYPGIFSGFRPMNGHQMSESVVHKTPLVVQEVNRNYQTLHWTYSDKDFMPGMFFALYPIHTYEAKLDSETTISIEFCEGGQADVKEKFLGRKVFWPQYADTYVFKLRKNGKVIGDWVYKELRGETAQKYAIVGESEFPILKEFYQKVHKHNTRTS
ncbi:MAG: hypothetical protein HYT98_00410 [Candidatus Sungbacteria bacterium]|nr:hypothetical protein [Candidatus Sungbacteria bacterium]